MRKYTYTLVVDSITEKYVLSDDGHGFSTKIWSGGKTVSDGEFGYEGGRASDKFLLYMAL